MPIMKSLTIGEDTFEIVDEQARQGIETLTNDLKNIIVEETDPTVPSWAKEPNKPTYTASEVGALPSTTKIPTKTSELDNDSGFLTSIPSEYVTDSELNSKGYLTEHQDLSDYAKKTDLPTVPTKTSQLSNDSGFLTSIPSEYVTDSELNSKGYLTEHQDLSNYAKKTDIPSVPTKTSQLTNDSGFLTSIPSEYVTESELSAKKYLTSIPSEYVTDSELTAKGYATQTSVTQLSEEIADLSVIVTPQMYGAVGDGVTDDTQAFRNALAENNNVFVPKGDYLITDTLDISSAKSLVSDNGQRATVLYDGSSSIINIGRLSMFRNINITVKNAFNGIVFDTNNNNKSFSSANLGARIEHVNVKFNTESPNATVIGITVDSGTDVNNKPKLTGICFQKYNDIHVAGAYGYGIKMELIQGRAFTEETKDGFPWITHIVFNDIFLDGAKTAIKSTVTNTSGNEPFNRIGVGNVLFNNVSTQYWSADKTKIFFDLNNFAGYFTKCIGWDYHPLTWAGEKVNIIGENVSACITDCAMDFGAEFLDTCDFTAETEYTATDNPRYFMDKYFKGTILSKGYDSINAKIDAKMTAEYIGNIADEKINDVLYSGYFNVLDDPLTKYKFGVRFSNSSQQWSTETSKMAIIIPIVQGGNIIRWNPDTYTLSIGYASLFFFNDDELTSGVLVGEHTNLWVSEGNGGYLMVDNPSGYKYVSIPFERNDNVSAETMTMTINREINGVNEKSYTEYLREDVINPAVEKEVQDYAQPKGDYALKTEIPTKTSQLTNDSKFITADDIPESQDLSGYAKKSDAETWTFTLKNGTTVTKKVVLG